MSSTFRRMIDGVELEMLIYSLCGNFVIYLVHSALKKIIWDFFCYTEGEKHFLRLISV